MVARVRIAPVERWCPEYANEPNFHAAAGMEIEIKPDTMRFEEEFACGCKSRYWRVVPESAQRIANACGGSGIESLFGSLVICEHMLEMD